MQTINRENALSIPERSSLEDSLIDTLIAWKQRSDALAQDTAAARVAVLKAKELKIWKPRYPSFKEWLAGECGITESWAYQLIGSAKVIAEIEDVAGKSKVLRPLLLKENRAVLENLSNRAIKALKQVGPKAAATIVMKSLAKDGPVLDKTIEAEVRAVTQSPGAGGPILAAMDEEWASMRKASMYVQIGPADVYRKLRAVVERMAP